VRTWERRAIDDRVIE